MESKEHRYKVLFKTIGLFSMKSHLFLMMEVLNELCCFNLKKDSDKLSKHNAKFGKLCDLEK